ncbi:Fur family transcriptional regulator [Pseudomonas sp. WHRI 8519]|uniref:Fur family transcriptional regulator n=1 Tax=Pseudomonas sp. WHRI 8519 TaxID=3162567 RepID=UPI0032F0412F
MQLTSNQQRVLTALRQADKPLSAYAILDSLRNEGVRAPTQIYRALGHLAEQGLIHRLESLNAYVSCTCPGQCEAGFRAFAICDSCGHVDEFNVPHLSQALGLWMKQNVFSLCSSVIELHGQCALCTRRDAGED